MSEAPLDAARASGLVRAGEPLLVLVSGGGDSVCLLDVALRLGARVSALHVNYGLREGADEDEAFVRELCERLGVPLHVERVAPAGERQPAGAGPRRALRTGGAARPEATTPPRTRPATRPRRCSTGWPCRPARARCTAWRPRRGRLVRPLLAVTRDEVRDYLRARGLEWREDPSNADRRFARARVRHDLLAALREIGPAPERTIAATAAQLREEAELLERAVDAALEELGGGPAVSLAALREQPPALRRLVLRRLAGDRPVPDEVLELDERGSSSLDLGEGLRAVAEYGTLRFTCERRPRGAGAGGADRAGHGRASGAGSSRPPPGMEGDVAVSAAALGDSATVRAWRAGDRMRPLGLGGTKTLQDLFTDRKVPRALRRTLPVVEVRGEVAWVAGVALDERFAARPGEPSVGLTARAR